MSPQSEARNRIRNQFGSAVAQKATDAFVAAHDEALAGIGIEAGVPAKSATVVEIRQDAPRYQVRAASRESIRALENASVAVLKEMDHYADVSGIGLATIRRHLVGLSRDAFFQQAGGIVDELAKASGGPLGPLNENVTLRALQPHLVETCWLNGTIRTAADPRTIAAVADDPRVQVIDVPRRLMKEINATASLVGAPGYRTAHGVSGKNVIVAVIDSEVGIPHPTLGNRVIHKANYTREPWGHPDAHGTAVAGIVGAASNTLSGMAPEVTIYNYKVLAATAPVLNSDDFGGALAIQAALEDGAQVANCSWGAGMASDGSSREARACDAAWGLGLVLVKSAGNLGPGSSTLTTPADASGVIVVGATDRQGRGVPDYSSRGPTATGEPRPHLVAPGGTIDDEMTSCVIGGMFGFCSYGTSFAAPHVTGLAALLLSTPPSATPDELREMLLDSCTAIANVDADAQGRGLVVLR